MAIVEEVSRSNPFSSQYFSYLVFRSGPLPDWPDEDRLKELFSVRPHSMLFQIVRPLRDLETFAINYANYTEKPKYVYAGWRREVLLGGGFFMGDSKAIADFSRDYYDLLYDAVEDGAFVGKDQELMNFIAIRDYFIPSKRAIYIGSRNCGDVSCYSTVIKKSQLC